MDGVKPPSSPSEPDPDPLTEPEVRAGGGVVHRAGTTGVEVLLIHRPHYDDWSFPKGKAENGEGDRVCAVREVEEETGYRVDAGVELSPVHYVDHKGRTKRVRYWLMTVTGGEGHLEHETDESRWLRPAAARRLLSYDLDRQVLDEARVHLEPSPP